MHGSVAAPPILTVPNPVLRLRAKPVDDPSSVAELARAMEAAMAAADGIGLAAPQVGQSRRVVVVSGLAFGDGSPNAVLVNPAFAEVSPDFVQSDEGCLSIPRLRLQIKRHRRVVVEYADLAGNTRFLEASGRLAAVLQHEVDHLDGTLITDKVGRAKLRLAQARLAKR